MRIQFFLPVFILLSLVFEPAYAAKIYTPSSSNSVTGGGTFCQGATASLVKFKYNNCNTGSGAGSGTALTVQWYSNTSNSTTGGTLVSTVSATTTKAATGTVSYRPSTSSTGALYYYCVITWAGTGTCNTSGSLTSGSAVLVTVKGSPTAITGPPTVCAGSTVTLSDALAGGTWSSLNTGKATINASTGVVTGVAAGNATIKYTTGCGTAVTYVLTVYPSTTPAITGNTNICLGSTSALANATPFGTWSSSNSAIASVNSSTGLVTSVATGSCTVSYTICGAPATATVTVLTAPASITGAASVCITSTTTLNDATTGGQWSSSNTANATVGSGTGLVTGVAQGTSMISYIIGTCYTTSAININTTPAAISGNNFVCLGLTGSYTDASTGGTWSSSNSSIVSIDPATGIATGVATGGATLTYTTGCGAAVTKAVTVISTPAAITGTTTVCSSSSVTLNDATTGGGWTSGNTSVATVTAGTGLVTGVSAGTTLISYTVSGCASTATVTVNIAPAAITGTASACSGFTSVLSNSVGGGAWSSSNTSIATVDASGNVTAISGGTCTITYSTGCGTNALKVFTVIPTPVAIAGSGFVCVSGTTNLTDATGGGTWSSSDNTLATVGAGTGIVTGVATGIVEITYRIGACLNVDTLNVNALPAPGLITGG